MNNTSLDLPENPRPTSEAVGSLSEMVARSSYQPLVLVVDDDPSIQRLLEHYLNGWGLSSYCVGSSEQLMSSLRTLSPNVILLDLQLGGPMDGPELVAALRSQIPEVPVMVITGHGSIDTAVQCMRSGCFDYITKPLNFERLEIELRKALELNRLTMRVHDLEERDGRFRMRRMIGGSATMRRVYQLIECVAPTDASVLILGETGTGKELVAHALHEMSPRSSAGFVPVNMAAIPRELIESTLFGHEKGAFTGAHQPAAGLCEQADGGTLFLDEIGEMDASLQAKLLRFLQDRTIWRVGSRTGRPVDVRVVAATNRDPAEQISKGLLREDLYYRLNVVSVQLPPLRERDGDIPLLVHHQLERASKRHNRSMRNVQPQAMERLEAYTWPGNVRELENLMEQIVVTNREDTLTLDMLPRQVREARPTGFRSLPELTSISGAVPTMEEMERNLIAEALRLCGGKVYEAARRLQISEATIYRKIKKFSLTRVP